MEIIKVHYKLSKPVDKFGEISADAEALRRYIVKGNFNKGLYNKVFALAHCQVSETPYAFFVVSPDVIAEKMFEDDIIINPKIIEAKPNKLIGNGVTVPNYVQYDEMCMSFPFRQPKPVTRFDKIKVQYQVQGTLWGLRTVEAELSGIASEIFQHEYDHTLAKNIYFESEEPVKWWTLYGHEKSKGGSSIDPIDSQGLITAKESASDMQTPRQYVD